MNRAEAIAAGLFVGECDSCQDDVWSDRGSSVAVRGYVWHTDCAVRLRDLLDEALS